MRPVIKMQEVVGEGRGEEAGTGRALRRRLDEAGAAVQDETRLLRAHAAAQALAIQGMEQTRGIGEQLVQAKLRIAELTAEMKKKDAVMQEKERYYCELMQSKDAVIQSKDVALQEKVSHFGKLIKCKDELLQLEDAEIRRLQADLARLSSEVAAGGAALHPAPARAAAAADAADVAEFLFQHAWKKAYGKKSQDAEVVRNYRFAAAQGHAGAQNNLGVMFEDGLCVAKDDAEAVRLYRLAAAQGHAVAQYNLGKMFASGRGVAQNDAVAVRWYRLAAEQGHAGATAALARFGA